MDFWVVKHLLTIVNNAAVNVSVQIPVCGFVFTSFVNILRSGIAQSVVILCFFEALQGCFHRGYTILHCHQKCTQVPVFPVSGCCFLFVF